MSEPRFQPGDLVLFDQKASMYPRMDPTFRIKVGMALPQLHAHAIVVSAVRDHLNNVFWFLLLFEDSTVGWINSAQLWDEEVKVRVRGC